MPFVGTSPSTTPILSKAWRESSIVSPSASMLPSRSESFSGNLQAGAEKKEEKQTRQDYADKSQFLSDHGQDEVGVGFRQIEQFLLARSQPLSEKAARAHCYPCLNELISRRKGIQPGIEKGLPPAAAVRDQVDELIDAKGGKGGH